MLAYKFEITGFSNILKVIIWVSIVFISIFAGVMGLIYMLMEEGEVLKLSKNFKILKCELPYQLKNSIETNPELNNNHCITYNYNAYYRAEVNGISYEFVERNYSKEHRVKYTTVRKTLYETVIIIRHNKDGIPNFYLNSYYNTFLGFLLPCAKGEISFPEDKKFSKRYTLKERKESDSYSNLKEKIKRFFSKKVRDLFLRYYIHGAQYYNYNDHELVVVVSMGEFPDEITNGLSDSDKEKIYRIADTLFRENK